MRVISGSARGRRLFGPPSGASTRPTSDKVRQALFNVLGERVVNARVIEMFSGTGALSVEALSRGAAHATLIDCDPGLCSLARRNLQTAGMADRAKILCRDVRRVNGLLAGARFDMALLDPPYGLRLEHDALRALEDGQLLEDDALVVLEHAKRDAPALPTGWSVARRYDYGDTSLVFLDRPGFDAATGAAHDAGETEEAT